MKKAVLILIVCCVWFMAPVVEAADEAERNYDDSATSASEPGSGDAPSSASLPGTDDAPGLAPSTWWNPDWSHRYCVAIQDNVFSRESPDVRVNLPLIELPGADGGKRLVLPQEIRTVDGSGRELPHHVVGYAGDRVIDIILRLHDPRTRFVYAYFGNPEATIEFYPVRWRIGRTLVNGSLPDKAARHGAWVWEREDRSLVHLGLAPPFNPDTERSGGRSGHGACDLEPIDVRNRMIRVTQFAYLDPVHPPDIIEVELMFQKSSVRMVWGSKAIDLDNTSYATKLGELPETGRWVRLDAFSSNLPIDAADKMHGVGYYQYGGRVKWGPTYLGSVTKEGYIDYAETRELDRITTAQLQANATTGTQAVAPLVETLLPVDLTGKVVGQSVALDSGALDDLLRTFFIDVKALPSFIHAGRKGLFSVQIDPPPNRRVGAGAGEIGGIELVWKPVYRDGEIGATQRTPVVFPAGDAFFWTHVFHPPPDRRLREIQLSLVSGREVIRTVSIDVLDGAAPDGKAANEPYIYNGHQIKRGERFVVFDASDWPTTPVLAPPRKPYQSVLLLGRDTASLSAADVARLDGVQAGTTKAEAPHAEVIAEWPGLLAERAAPERVQACFFFIGADLLQLGLTGEQAHLFFSDCVRLCHRRGVTPILVLERPSPHYRQLQFNLRATVREVAQQLGAQLVDLTATD